MAMAGIPNELHSVLSTTLILKEAEQRAKNKNSAHNKMASSVSSIDFIEGGLSAGILIGANTLITNDGQFDSGSAFTDGIQQGALTIAAPVARSALAGAGIALPLSVDIADPILVGVGTGLVDKARGLDMDYAQIFYSVGAAFLARKGKDLWSYGNLESSGNFGSIMG